MTIVLRKHIEVINQQFEDLVEILEKCDISDDEEIKIILSLDVISSLIFKMSPMVCDNNVVRRKENINEMFNNLIATHQRISERWENYDENNGR